MARSNRVNSEDDETRMAIDRILREDRYESQFEEYSSTCQESSRREKKALVPNCAVEYSARFSLRVMEAMRSLRRRRSDFATPISTEEDIVDYIERNYCNDGDVSAQVRTVLTRVCRQGFVVKTGVNEYHLLGPFAYTVSNVSCSKDCEDYSLCRAVAKNESERKSQKRRHIGTIDACSVGRSRRRRPRLKKIQKKGPCKGRRKRRTSNGTRVNCCDEMEKSSRKSRNNLPMEEKKYSTMVRKKSPKASFSRKRAYSCNICENRDGRSTFDGEIRSDVDLAFPARFLRESTVTKPDNCNNDSF